MQEPFKDEKPQNNPEDSPHHGSEDHKRRAQDVPEPPLSWRPTNNQNQITQSSNAENQSDFQQTNPQSSQPNNSAFRGTPPEFERIRKLLSIAQICAVISLFIGGVVLSTIALVFGIMGYRALSSAMRDNTLEPNYTKPLRQSCIIALIMSVTALVVNVIALVYIYPLVMQALNTGDFSTLMGGGAQYGSSTGTGSTTWG